jgi:hypothetical protein
METKLEPQDRMLKERVTAFNAVPCTSFFLVLHRFGKLVSDRVGLATFTPRAGWKVPQPTVNRAEAGHTEPAGPQQPEAQATQGLVSQINSQEPSSEYHGLSAIWKDTVEGVEPNCPTQYLSLQISSFWQPCPRPSRGE